MSAGQMLLALNTMSPTLHFCSVQLGSPPFLPHEAGN